MVAGDFCGMAGSIATAANGEQRQPHPSYLGLKRTLTGAACTGHLRSVGQEQSSELLRGNIRLEGPHSRSSSAGGRYQRGK